VLFAHGKEDAILPDGVDRGSRREGFTMRSFRWACVPVLALFAAAAAASFHTFVIEQLYSNADGSIQFIVLTEDSGLGGQEFLAGHVISSTQGGTQHKFAFPKNLPSSDTGHRSFLVATPGFAALGLTTPDYVMPAGFLFADGGSVNYASVDQVSFAALPTDGVNALNRNGTTSQNLARNFAGATASVVAAPPTVTVVEYHHAAFDHYFITPVADEIAKLDARTPPFQDWSRTGFSFKAYVNATAPAGSNAICRFFNDHFAPKSSHFYAGHGFGCEDTLRLFPDWGLEDDKLFNALLPDASGVCPAGTIPVYRLYNGGMGGAPNHRFVTSLAERQKMLDLHYIPEGTGVGVGMCAPA
jgi:hypothetical protein